MRVCVYIYIYIYIYVYTYIHLSIDLSVDLYVEHGQASFPVPGPGTRLGLQRLPLSRGAAPRGAPQLRGPGR